MLSSTQIYDNGMIETVSAGVATHHTGPAMAAVGGGGRDLFGRFVSVYQSNEFLFSELKSVKQKLSRAKAYLETPGSHPVLARAHLDQLRAHHSAVLTMLRANRHQAQALLARTETRSEAEVA